MSNFGNLYEINTELNVKNKYPVLNISNKYFVCKVYGTNWRKSIPIDPKNGFNIINLDQYYKIINHRKNFNGFVYIPHEEKEYPVLPQKYFWGQTLGDLNEEAEKLIAEINYMQHNFKICSKELDRIREYLSQFTERKNLNND